MVIVTGSTVMKNDMCGLTLDGADIIISSSNMLTAYVCGYW